MVTLKYFHKVGNGRRNRKFIKTLVNEEGTTLDNFESILEEIAHFFFFEKLYSKPFGNLWRLEGLD